MHYKTKVKLCAQVGAVLSSRREFINVVSRQDDDNCFSMM